MRIKLNLGFGPTPFEGWINIDKSWNAFLYRFPLLKSFGIKFLLSFKLVAKSSLEYITDYPQGLDIRRHDITKGLLFDDNSVDFIYTSQLLEHLTRKDAISLLNECYRVLKPDGVIRIIVPDLRTIVSEYVNGSSGDEFMDNLMLHNIGDFRPFFEKLISKKHQWMYDFDSLSKLAYDCGFSDVEEHKVREGNIPKIQHLEKNYQLAHPRSLFVEARK